MPPKEDPSQLNADFGHEVEAERQQLLRRRFLWYTGTVACFTGLAFLIGIFATPENGGRFFHILGLIFAGASTSLFVGSFVYVYLNHATRWPLIKICLWLIVVSGLLNLLAGRLAFGQMESIIRASNTKIAANESKSKARALKKALLTSQAPATTPNAGAPPVSPPGDSVATETDTDPANADTDGQINPNSGLPEAEIPESFRQSMRDNELVTAVVAISAGLGGAFSIFGRHFLACLFLPLTPRECIRPLIPLLIFNAVLVVIYVARAMFAGAGWGVALAGLCVIAVSPAIGIPGYLVVAWRDSNFRERVGNRLMRRDFTEMNRELIDARRIHESLFPKPFRDTEISLTYAYEPMRQIGGDYLFCKHTLGPAGNQRLNIVMLDVTGHGIPAALTVNRLHGELERIFAEQPNTDPGEVIRLLNRYVNLTLAGHWVYVTGLCVRVDSVAQSLEFASGGHPPAFLHRADGTLDELHSTAMILGAVPDSEFDAAMETRKFSPSDRLIAYTDGAFECTDRKGNQLRIAGIRSLISRGPGTIADWPAAIITCVKQFRDGLPTDDTLVVELHFSTTAPQAPRQEPKTEFFRAARSGIYRAIKN